HCYILRMPTRMDGSAEELVSPLASVELPAQKPGVGYSLVVRSLLKGEIGEATEIDIRESNEDSFTLIARLGPKEEIYPNVTLGKMGETTVETINRTSQLIRVQVLESSSTFSDRTPVMGQYKLAMPRTTDLEALDINIRTFEGDVSERKGIGSLEAVDEVTMVCAPDLMSAFELGALDITELIAAQLALIAHCEHMGDRVAILDSPANFSPQDVANWRYKTAGFDSKYACLYYPWIQIEDMDGKPFFLPPSGHIAGIYTRNDNERGVHKAPANEIVRGAFDLELEITTGEQDILNPMGINCLRQFPGRGIRVWGARTLSSDPAWRYVNVRRLFNFVEESIREGTQWVVYEPNDHYLWSRVARDISAFLRNIWRKGALFGDTPEEAFYVKCDEELNPPEQRDKGELIVEIGMAPVKPAEFIIFRISQWAGGGA
ncbi:MAG: phage tail sheath family protein, partial [Anaerolineales bacterium]|nr:phage tail sheath family protein [Anaerolineales bacterium]